MYILLLWIGIKLSMPVLYYVLLALFWIVNVVEYCERH